MGISTDIDIDLADRTIALKSIPHVPAILERKSGESERRHPSGVYLQNIPVDPATGNAVYDYKEASNRGYVKLDFLTNSLYLGVRDEAHLDRLLNTEPEWSLLDHPEIVSQLVHIHNHFTIVAQIRPRSISDLALVLALMRPGKRHLIGKPRDEIESQIWESSGDDFQFKKSHSIAYAASIVVQLNLICEKTAEEIDAA